MKTLIMAVLVGIAGVTAAAQSQKVTVTVENETPVSPAQVRRVALVVQNHAAPGAAIPMMALTDALTAKLSNCGFEVVNPYNAVGVNQNRNVVGEKTPNVSTMQLARKLKADGAITASVIEFLDSTIGSPPILHQYSVRVSFGLADAQTGAAVCGETIKVKSPKYTNNQIAANRAEYLGDLLHSTADECAARLASNPRAKAWRPAPLPSATPRPPKINPNLTLADVDGAIQQLVGQMRTNPIFIANYDKAQKAIGRVPLAIVGGLVDMTEGNSPCASVAALLAAGTQTVRMTLVNSALFEAKDDALVTDITRRIIANGNSPLEDGELMSALKQHGSPDFFVVGDMMYFAEGDTGRFRLRLALHNLHTGKIVWEGAQTIAKPIAKAKPRAK